MPRLSQLTTVCVLTMVLAALFGCYRNWDYWDNPPEAPPPEAPLDEPPIDDAPAAPAVEIPHPISLLLPKRINIHPFTRARPTTDSDRGSGVLEVRIQLMDSFDDPGKGFGQFRFTLFQYRTTGVDRRGQQLETWDEDLSRPSRNLAHWDAISNAYKFNLKRVAPFVEGQRYVLEAYFTSPYTEQLFDESAITVGE